MENSKNKIICDIVEDSRIHALSLIKLIKDASALELGRVYENAIEANKGIKENRPNILFLDVGLPVLSGFDLLKAMDNPPLTILVTGDKGHALTAYYHGVTDYLCKPIDKQRFAAVVKRCYDILSAGQSGDHFFVKSGTKRIRMERGEILRIRAMGDYMRIVCKDRMVTVLSTFKSLLAMPELSFLERCHKSHAVDFSKVESYTRKGMLIDGFTVPVSRKYLKMVRTRENLKNA